MFKPVIGYMFHGSRIGRESGVLILDERCALRVFGSANCNTPVFAENIGPYSQSCHECGEPIVKDGWCELFVKPGSHQNKCDHTDCGQEKHDTSAEGTEGEAQELTPDGKLACNHCKAPMYYCYTYELYFHLDPDVPDCFLIKS